MASTLQTTLITGRLLDASQVAQLSQQLQAAGFNMVQVSPEQQQRQLTVLEIVVGVQGV
jgi:hypothetical protein